MSHPDTQLSLENIKDPLWTELSNFAGFLAGRNLGWSFEICLTCDFPLTWLYLALNNCSYYVRGDSCLVYIRNMLSQAIHFLCYLCVGDILSTRVKCPPRPNQLLISEYIQIPRFYFVCWLFQFVSSSHFQYHRLAKFMSASELLYVKSSLGAFWTFEILSYDTSILNMCPHRSRFYCAYPSIARQSAELPLLKLGIFQPRRPLYIKNPTSTKGRFLL